MLLLQETQHPRTMLKMTNIVGMTTAVLTLTVVLAFVLIVPQVDLDPGVLRLEHIGLLVIALLSITRPIAPGYRRPLSNSDAGITECRVSAPARSLFTFLC